MSCIVGLPIKGGTRAVKKSIEAAAAAAIAVWPGRQQQFMERVIGGGSAQPGKPDF
jgi:hypothetical protein